ncbi:MAG: tryptophan synthase subunit alpha [Hespellia sp.]|nr:tryptophan synthase subunit alpha [Hespellia sp.]
MSKIRCAFQNGKAFLVSVTAGDLSREKTVEFIRMMESAGADLIEIGIPFSDPTGEGIVIQDANIRALLGGMTTDGVFDIVREIRETSQIPLVFLTYLNPVFHYGYERFLTKCEGLGVDGLIIPDLPFEEKGELADIAKAHGVDIISTIAPTSRQRIQRIASEASGFVYVAASMGVTGTHSENSTDIVPTITAIRQVTDIPVAVGFGIRTPEQAGEMAKVSDGAIVGTEITKLIAKHGENASAEIYEYVKKMKEAIREAK